MQKQTQLKAMDVLKNFLTGLDVIEKDIEVKQKEVEKIIFDYNKYLEDLKVQEKESEKRWLLKSNKITDELKNQEKISKQLTDELAKQSGITKEMEKKHLSAEEYLETLRQGKKEILAEVEKQKKLTLEVKSKKEEQERLQNTNIERSKKFDDEFARLNIKEAQIHSDRNKLDRDKLEFDNKQNSLDLRVKNIEHIEKRLKINNG
jgi:chromosome segregation ATPase